MNAVYEEIIVSSLLRYSVSQDYNKAKNEWSYDGEVIDHGPIKDQMGKMHCTLCGHPIRYEYIITNKESKKKIGTGSECITNFMNVDPYRMKKDIKINQEKNRVNSLNAWLSMVKRIGNKMVNTTKEKYGIVEFNQFIDHCSKKTTEEIKEISPGIAEAFRITKPQKEVIDKLAFRWGYLDYPRTVRELIPALINIAEYYGEPVDQKIIDEFLQFNKPFGETHKKKVLA